MQNYVTYTLNRILHELRSRRRRRPQESLMDAARAVVTGLKPDDLEFAAVEVHFGLENFRADHVSDADLTERDVLIEAVQNARGLKQGRNFRGSRSSII